MRPVPPAFTLRRFSARHLARPSPSARGMLFLDYDGTLAPIAARPGGASMSKAMRGMLEKAAAHPRWQVCIVSGRALADVKRRVGLKELVYVGNHGFEIQFPRRPVFVHPDAAEAVSLLDRIADQIRHETAALPGVILENKRFTLSLHTRLANVRSERRAHLALRHATRAPLERGQVVIRRGKKVLEVRPAVAWDKGAAVMAVLTTEPERTFRVYLGDDNTDEDAFRALANIGVTIRVGRGETNARFYVDSVADMPATIESIIGLLPDR